MLLDPTFIEVARRARKNRVWTREATTRSVDLGRDEIHRMIPHRDPFAFVDRVVAFDPTQRAAEGIRHIREDDPVFVGHFPTHPVYPGVLLVETMGQLACCLRAMIDGRQLDVRALSVQNATFIGEVRPGANLTVLARELDDGDTIGVAAGQILDGDRIVAACVMEVYFVES